MKKLLDLGGAKNTNTNKNMNLENHLQ